MRTTQSSNVSRFTRRDYERLVEHGVLDEEEPIELVDGLPLVKEPEATPPAVRDYTTAFTLDEVVHGRFEASMRSYFTGVIARGSAAGARRWRSPARSLLC